MKKLSLLSFFAICFMTAFAFNNSVEIENQTENQLVMMCTGWIYGSAECAGSDPGDATVTIRDLVTGALVYSGPADANANSLTLNPGKYEVSASTSGHCQITVKWSFCGTEFADIVDVNSTSVVVGYIEI